MLIALGVTGGIGAYKAVEVARGLQKRGHEVVAIMTASATRFVGPVTFEAITRRRVITDQFEPGANADIEHIALASTIDLLLVAPATANIIGKFANGIADDFLSTLYTATRAPVLLAPAMNTQMFEHEAVRRNLDTLAARGVRFVEPGEGYLACGWIGKGPARRARRDRRRGRSDPAAGRAAARAARARDGRARPTKISIPVRYVGNRSSGRMGFAIAAEAARRGAEVTLVAGPTALEPPPVREVVRVRSAAEMHEAVIDARRRAWTSSSWRRRSPTTRRRERAAQKMAKGGDTLTLVLQRTPDILGDLGRAAAGERATGRCSSALRPKPRTSCARATAKREQKHVDLIVANDVSRADAGFDVDTNAVTIVGADGAETLPLQTQGARRGGDSRSRRDAAGAAAGQHVRL